MLMAITIIGTEAYAAPATTAPMAKPAASTPTAPPAPKLATPGKLRAYSSYNTIRLTWTAVPKAQSYIIYRSVADKKKFTRVGITKDLKFINRVPNNYTTYAYRVTAATRFQGKLIQSAPAKIRQSSVGKLRMYIKFKKNKKYKEGTIHKGSTHMADSAGGGYYVFQYKGKKRTISRVAVQTQGSKYKKKDNYSKAEASLFVTDYLRAHRISSSRKYVIWVSTQTQHLYVLKKKKGAWSVVRGWEVSTGKATTPTSTGTKQIKKKVFRHHDIQFWNCFSGWNALHGVRGNMDASIGRPASSGCVRNKNADAAWLYANCAKGTTVIIY